ncbi:MAG: C39 family peptidase [Cyanobacteria bacterium SZAS-4]|nr:C39 family peptidase [Cyanobacteria bacterium SZAS-4]
MKNLGKSEKINLAALAVLVILTLVGVYVANNPTSIHELELRAKYLNRVVKLPVPYAHQEHSLSCEIACLKMALNYQGAHVGEPELIKLMPFDSTPNDKGIWGNPNQAFVGDIDGESGVNGYGVYWEPIAQLGRHWRKTQTLENGSVQDLTANLLAKRPIVIWGHSGTGVFKNIDWNTSSGKRVSAVSGEHTRVVTGFAGDPQNPDVFFILDPYFGELIWSKEELEKNWQSLGNHGVVVYADTNAPQ